MYGVAVMGYGIVGSGVVEAFRTNAELIREKTGLTLKVTKILDVYDFPDSPDAHLITHDVGDIMQDDDIKVVVETIGGIREAYKYTKMAFESGKHVVTSNKELVAVHGPELLKLASDNGVVYLFEASVGGGVPIIRPLERCLIANEIQEIMGIVNGTTNYMLTYMQKFGAGFSETLKLTQEKGFAEKDPSADIEGHDACRKIAILSSIAFGSFVDCSEIYTEGISKITTIDVASAEGMGFVIKLIARSRRVGNKVMVGVYPMMLRKQHILSNVDGVFNGILVRGNIVGDVMFYGQGAGKEPTSSAIIADIIDAISDISASKRNWRWDRDKKLEIANTDDDSYRYYTRFETDSGDELMSAVFKEFPDAVVLPHVAGSDSSMLMFTTAIISEKMFKHGLESIQNSVAGVSLCTFIRIYSEI